MYKLDLPVNPKEAAVIERRKNLEDERKSRIFNARVRLIGVDEKALSSQVHERRHAENTDKQRNEAYARDMIRNDKLAVLLQDRQDRDVRKLEKGLNDFRFQKQTPDTRREWDLNDPEMLKKSTPVRTNDEDASLGISSCQIFDGEDLSGKERKKSQQTQRQQWTDAQCEELNHAKEAQAYADYSYQMKQNALDAEAVQLRNEEEDCRRKVAIATKEFNLQQAEERKQRELNEASNELQDNLTEIRNHVLGDLLTENPAVARSAFGSHRVITDRWKGMSSEQIESIRNIQSDQVHQKNKSQSNEKRINDQWDNNRIKMAKAATLMERAETRQRRELQRELVEENKRMAKEQAERLNNLDHVVYVNRPSNDYFDQFNTTSR